MDEPVLFGWPISAWKDVVEAAALVLAGFWAYMLFVRGRQRFPRASLTHRITHRNLPDGQVLLHVNVLVANPGLIVLRIKEAEARVQQLLPLPDDVREAIELGKDPVPKGEREVPWALLSERTCEWKKRQFEIEPGEADESTWDFVLPSDVHTVEVYNYFRNAKKRRKDIGWGLTTLYDVRPAAETKVETVIEGMTGKERES
jgi:hypothetical protein